MGDLKPLLVPETLRDALAAEAAREGVSLEVLAARAVERHHEAAEARAFFAERASRSDPEWLLRFLDRDDGEAPGPGDELPEGYRGTK